MADTSLNVAINTPANLGGLNQTVQAINQVTAAQQRQAAVARQSAQGTGVAQAFSNSALSGIGLGGLTGGVAGAVGAGTAALLGFVKVLTDSAGRTRDLAEQLGLSTAEFQRMEQAALDTGVSFSRLAGSLGIMEQQRKAAAEGNLKLREAFNVAGISLDDLNNESLRAIDLQGRLAAATAAGTQAQRDAVRTILGAQGARLLPALQAMEALKAASIASPEGLQAVDEYGKFWERTWAKIKAGGIDAFGSLSLGLQRLFRQAMGDNTPDAPSAAQVEREEFEAFKLQNLTNARTYSRRRLEAQLAGNEPEAQRNEQLRQRALANAGMTIEQWRALNSGGALFEDRAAAQQVAELDQQRLENAEKRRKLEFDLLTPAQQRADIERRIAENKAEMALGDEFGVLTDLEREQMKGRGLDLEAQLAGLNKAGGNGAATALPANVWERLGASFGGGADKADQAIQVQRDTQRAVERVAASLDSFAALAQLGVPVSIKDE